MQKLDKNEFRKDFSVVIINEEAIGKFKKVIRILIGLGIVVFITNAYFKKDKKYCTIIVMNNGEISLIDLGETDIPYKENIFVDLSDNYKNGIIYIYGDDDYKVYHQGEELLKYITFDENNKIKIVENDIYNYEISEKEENGISKQYQRARDKKYKTQL